MRRQKNRGDSGFGTLLLFGGIAAVAYYFMSGYSSQVVTGTTANPITVAGGGIVPLDTTNLGPTLPQGPSGLMGLGLM